ncbi:MAG: YraN family protein [Sulfurospirillum sp.]|nr:MAG: YraN family protein [Sulfurospirillum sp.]
MSRAKGKIGEDQALLFLQDRDFKVIDRNFYSRFGEIDLIAIKDETLHFIEVKSGKWDPVHQITPAKLKKIIKTAQIYLSKNRLDMEYCFDAVIVEDNEINLIENITF